MNDKPGARPSLLRIPLTAAALVTVLPLAPFVWIALSGHYRGQYLRSAWVRRGGGVMLVSLLPLLAVGAAAVVGIGDPNPNPIGLGLLAMAGGMIGIVLVLVGVIGVARSESR